MTTSRFNRKSHERLLSIASVLVFLVILSVIIWVIPHVVQDTTRETRPAMAGLVFWALTLIHLIVLVIIIRNLWISVRGGRMRKTWLIIIGIILIMTSMFLIDAGANLQNLPEMFSVAMILFISAFCDLITGIITIMLPTRLPYD